MTPDSVRPVVFISYSHDSADHKVWVSRFAQDLLRNGIQVLLDQWECGPGDDLGTFMQRAVRDADRVLMICSEAYVQKAEDGVGGVGFEAMIVTGELVQRIGTNKFVPVLRGNSHRFVPGFLGYRLYVDFNDEEGYDEILRKLVDDLHLPPGSRKPPLGPIPRHLRTAPDQGTIPAIEIVAATGSTAVAQESVAPALDDKSTVRPPFQSALAIARRGSLRDWRMLVEHERNTAHVSVVKWRREADQSLGRASISDTDLLASAAEGTAKFESLIATAIAGMASEMPHTQKQAGLLHDLMRPKDWNIGGYVLLTEVPIAAAFLYQALHGAMSIFLGKVEPSIELARSRVRHPVHGDTRALYEHSDMIGWPNSFGRSHEKAWKTLLALPEQWSWIIEAFGSRETYEASLAGYYIAINVNQFVSLLPAISSTGIPDITPIPIGFALYVDGAHVGRGYQMLLEDKSGIRWIWLSANASFNAVQEYWPSWIDRCRATIGRSSPWASIGHCVLPHDRLPDDVGL